MVLRIAERRKKNFHLMNFRIPKERKSERRDTEKSMLVISKMIHKVMTSTITNVTPSLTTAQVL